MKTLLVSFTLIILASYNLYSQSGWFWNNPLPQGNTLRDVQFIDENLVVAVGYCGTFIKSTDKGANWEVKQYIAGVAELIMGVYFVNKDIGYAVGSAGTITKTTDGGKNWTRQSYNGNAKLNSVAFINADTGIIVGDAGTILRTIDGGLTWILIDGGTPQHLFQIKIIDANDAAIVGDQGKILHSTDGGLTWYVQESHSSKPLVGVSFLDRNIGLVVGTGGLILKTTNGGVVWDTLTSGTKQGFWGVSFLSANEYVAVGGPYPSPWLGVIVHSTDAGKTWSYSEPESPTLYAVSFHGSNGIIVGNAGVILQTRDNGATLSTVSRGNSYEDYVGIKFSSPLNGYIAGRNGHILRTIDGGTSWSQLTMPWGKYDSPRIIDFNVTSDSVITVVGSFNGPGYQYQAMRTEDGGMKWNYLKAAPSSSHCDKISFINDTIGLILWGSNHVSRTSDGGKTWSQYWTGVNVWLNSIILVDANVGYAAGGYDYGDSATVIKTTDGGKSWFKVFSSTQYYYLGSVYFTDPDHGNVIGKDIAMRTSNGGADWIIQNASIIKNINYITSDMHFADLNNGISVSGGSIYRTTDGGKNWVLQKSGTNNSLFGVYMFDYNNAFVVGEAQTILQTKTGGIVSVKEKRETEPSDFILNQNYPNPFGATSMSNNASTTICYSLTKRSHVRLIITNLLGQKIQALVDNNIDAGEYSVQFNANKLPSGLYFYRLETDKNVLVKKMMIIR